MGFVSWSVQNDRTIHILFKLSALTAGSIFILCQCCEGSGTLGSHSNFSLHCNSENIV